MYIHISFFRKRIKISIYIYISLTRLPLQGIYLDFEDISYIYFFNIDTILLQKKMCCYCNYSYSQKPFLKYLPLIRQTSCNLDLLSSCKVLFGLPLILLTIFLFWLLGLSYQQLLLNCLFVL